MARIDNRIENLSVEDAQSRFRALVDSQRRRALWHLRPDIPIDIRGSSADAILDSIINSCDRTAWIQAKELKKWRLLYSR